MQTLDYFQTSVESILLPHCVRYQRSTCPIARSPRHWHFQALSAGVAQSMNCMFSITTTWKHLQAEVQNGNVITIKGSKNLLLFPKLLGYFRCGVTNRGREPLRVNTSLCGTKPQNHNVKKKKNTIVFTVVIYKSSIKTESKLKPQTTKRPSGGCPLHGLGSPVFF